MLFALGIFTETANTKVLYLYYCLLVILTFNYSVVYQMNYSVMSDGAQLSSGDLIACEQSCR